ncbi:hypothetical protein B7P43_G09890 [Cryptotermes secundus]|nr:hypothetical protein B7P43_G09890 [Cryptotermes secundus]
MSSISGSESESEDGESSDSTPSSVVNLSSSQNNEPMKITCCKVDVSGSYSEDEQNDDGLEKKHDLRLMAARHTKVFFENEDGKILSMYRCLLHGKKDVPENDEQLIPLALKVAANPVWAVIMLGGGHFAAGIFKGQEVLVHKTFHCYTVRSRQGGTQSSRDGRSGGSHPKSAGASLRRYNETALIQHVQDIMESWSSQLDTCGLILYRAVGHNGNVLFSGRNPPLSKTDSRLRTIPFATRRATFSEVKRVHGILTSVEMYGSGEAFQTSFPQTLRKRGFKSQAAQDESMSGKRINYEMTVEGSENTGPKRGSSKHNIDRAKSRKSPHRPLPGIVTAVLTRSSSESDISETKMTVGSHMIDEETEISFDCLQEFCVTVPQEMKNKKKHSKDNKRTDKKQQKKKVEKDLYSASVMALQRKLWASCRLGDTELLVNSLQTVHPIEEEPENCEAETTKINEEADNSEKVKPSYCRSENSNISRVEYLSCLNENVGENRETLLHVAAQGGHMAIVRALLEAGCDPSVKNKKSQTPYVVSANKETRNIFRRFWADFPGKYDYSKSQIAGPLTDDMEQKMAEKRQDQRKAKREREKERKKEEEVRRAEQAEKQRFLQLSDREKRALAAERRLLSQAVDSKVKPIVSRCFQCAVDITGKVPFEYDIHRFCSMDCLKQHRLKLKNLQHK